MKVGDKVWCKSQKRRAFDPRRDELFTVEYIDNTFTTYPTAVLDKKLSRWNRNKQVSIIMLEVLTAQQVAEYTLIKLGV